MLRITRLRLLHWLLFSFLLPCGYSQQAGSSGSTGTTSGGSTTARKEQPPIIIMPTPDMRLPPREIHPVFISGVVMLEDGSLPPFGAIIEMDCGGSKTREATVNQNGQFAFQFGGARRFNEIVPDASEGNSHILDADAIYWNPNTYDSATKIDSTVPLNVRLSGCDLSAQLSGYQSSAIRLDGAILTSVNDVGSIVLYSEDSVRGKTVSMNSLLAPKKAKSLLNRAMKPLEKGRLDEASRLLQSALEVYPDYAETWMQLGILYQKQRRIDDAIDALNKAIKAEPLFLRPYVQLAWLLSEEQKWQEAAAISDRALSLDPVSYTELYYLNALASYNLQNAEMAEKRARQTQKRDALHHYPKVHLLLANILEAKGNRLAAREELRNYLKYAPEASDAPLVRERLARKAQKSASIQP